MNTIEDTRALQQTYKCRSSRDGQSRDCICEVASADDREIKNGSGRELLRSISR